MPVVLKAFNKYVLEDIMFFKQKINNYPHMKQKLVAALATSPEADEIVITTVLSNVENLKGDKMPFLRVITTPEGLPDLKERLMPLGEDIEVIMLGEWIPKKETD